MHLSMWGGNPEDSDEIYFPPTLWNSDTDLQKPGISDVKSGDKGMLNLGMIWDSDSQQCPIAGVPDTICSVSESPGVIHHLFPEVSHWEVHNV